MTWPSPAGLVRPGPSNLFGTTLGLVCFWLLGGRTLSEQIYVYGLALETHDRALSFVPVVVGVAIGALLGKPVGALGGVLPAASLTSLSRSVWVLGLLGCFGSALLWYALPHGLLKLALCVHSASYGAALAFSVAHAWPTVLRHALDLGLVSWVLQPHALVGWAVVYGVLLVSLGRGEVSYAPGVLGLVSAGLVLQLEVVRLYLSRLSPRRIQLRLATLLALTAAGSLVWMSTKVPFKEREAHSGQVLYASGDQNSQRFVFASHRAGLELFVDGRIHHSALDSARTLDVQTRFVGPSARQVLLIGPGSGTLETRLLGEASLERLLVLTPSRELAEVSRNLPALQSAPWLDDPRVSLVEAEAMPWLDENSERFDRIIADVPVPLDQRSSKHFTRYFVDQLLVHLTPQGAALLPAFSPSRMPDTHGAVLMLVEHLPHRVQLARLPSLGDWTFVSFTRPVAGAPIPLPDGLSTLHAPLVGEFFRDELFLGSPTL